MNYLAHIFIALASIFLLFAATNQQLSAQVAAITVLGAILPDVDHAKSKAFKFFIAVTFATVFSTAFGLLQEGLAAKIAYSAILAATACVIAYAVKPRHRGVVHSVAAACVFTAACLALGGFHVALAGLTAFLSHLAADGKVKLL